jgi:lysophospholipase L1-like esterase
MAVAAVAALACIGAVWAIVAVEDGSKASTGSVTLLGDSLNVGIEPYLPELLSGWQIENYNEVGRRTEQGIDILRSLGGRVGSVLLVSLGTNDVQSDGGTFRHDVEQVLALAGPNRCVVWSTVWLDGQNRLFNGILRDEAARHANLEIADWASLVEDDRSLLAPDRVHGNATGYARKAEQVAEAARDCQPASSSPR